MIISTASIIIVAIVIKIDLNLIDSNTYLNQCFAI